MHQYKSSQPDENYHTDGLRKSSQLHFKFNLTCKFVNLTCKFASIYWYTII